MKSLFCVFLLFMIFCSCRKPQISPEEPLVENTALQNGLPPDIKKVKGIFYTSYKSFGVNSKLIYYAGLSENNERLSNINYYTQSFQHQSGQISAGDVFFSGAQLSVTNTGTSYFYFQDKSDDALPSDSVWLINGNNKISGFVEPGRGLPKIDSDINTVNILYKDQWLDLPSFLRNADSVIVIIQESYMTLNPKAVFRMKGVNQVKLERKQFMNFSPVIAYQCVMEIHVLNYAYRTINNRLFLFINHRMQRKGVEVRD